MNPGSYILEVVDGGGQIIGTSPFISAATGTAVASVTVTASSGALSAVSTTGGLVSTLTSTAARSVTYAAAAAGVAGVVDARRRRHGQSFAVSRAGAGSDMIFAMRRTPDAQPPSPPRCSSRRPVLAQTPAPDPDAEANIRFGPLSLKSTIALTNLGVDTNVFNQADADQPQSDFTMTFSPTTDVWLRMGRTWITGTVGGGLGLLQQVRVRTRGEFGASGSASTVPSTDSPSKANARRLSTQRSSGI